MGGPSVVNADAVHCCKHCSFMVNILRNVYSGQQITRSWINGLTQDCSNSSALAVELLQSCTKPSIWSALLQVPSLVYALFLSLFSVFNFVLYFEGILPKGPYLSCVSMAGRALLAGYPQFGHIIKGPAYLSQQVIYNMVLSLQDELVIVFPEKLFQLPFPSLCDAIVE